MLGIDFTNLTMGQMVDECLKLPNSSHQSARLIVTANMDHIVQLRRNADFRKAYDSAWQRTIDGAPVAMWATLSGNKKSSRITGSDLFSQLVDRMDPAVHRPFFVAANPETGEALCDTLLKRGFDHASVGTYCPPFGFENKPAETSALLSAIQQIQPTHLFIGVGAPKSEIWINNHKQILGPMIVLACGAGLEFYIGSKTRAPKFFQRFGLEWLWRLIHEPKRLARRYLLNSWSFLGAIIDDLRGKTIAAYDPPPLENTHKKRPEKLSRP